MVVVDDGDDDVAALSDSVIEAFAEETGEDDVAVLAVGVAALHSDRLAMRIDADPSSIASVRMSLTRWLALHLFRVAAGLDSMVPGEGEILGQVREAFEAGAPGPLLDRVFRHGAPRRQAARGSRPRSARARRRSPPPPPRSPSRCSSGSTGAGSLLVGAGRISELTARNLRSRGAPVAFVANRTLERAEALAADARAPSGCARRARRALAEADIVVSSTSAPGFVLTADELARPSARVAGGRCSSSTWPCPRDVDPAIATIDGCFVYDIDDLEAIVAASLAGRRREAVEAERIVAEEAERFRAWQASLAVVPAIASLRARAEEIRAAELARIEARLGRLPEGDRDVVETVTAQIVNKLLHLPTVRMKEAAVDRRRAALC